MISLKLGGAKNILSTMSEIYELFADYLSDVPSVS